ncbi:MAG: apolipoprotein N-acyltransferase [Actinomycetota bacterium]|jgi:apolipoprotein N-acyltransferase
MAITRNDPGVSTDSDAQAAAAAGPSARGRKGGLVAGALGLGLLSGVLATLAFPPFGLWPLIFVAFVPMVVGTHWLAPPRWGKAVIGVGIGTFIAGQLSAGLAEGQVAAVFQLMPLFFALIFMGVAFRTQGFHARTHYRWLALTTPLAWVAVDFIRASGSGVFNALGGTWAMPQYALFRIPTFLQPISIFGLYGLELLVLVINFAIGTLVVRRLHGLPFPRVMPAVVAGIVVAWTLLGFALMGSPARGDRTVRVAAIQTGTDDPAPASVRAQRFARDVAQTRAAASQGARLAVWNEVGLDFDPRVEHTDELKALARESNIHIAIGYGFTDSKARHHNEVVMLSPDGTFSQPYGKDHPGTFAGDYSDTQGTYPVKHTDFGVIGSVICYDMDFTDTARKMTRNGARLIAAPSNDVKAIAETHYTHLVFRSIENRVPTVKADEGYDSAIIDQWGRIENVTANPSGIAQRTLIADVTLGSGKSPFVSLGDWFGWIAVAGVLAAIVLSRASVRRNRG